MVTITKEPKPRLEPIILSPEDQIEVQKIMTIAYRSSTRSTKMGQDMSSIFADETFDRWNFDPPYDEENALKMYDTRLPSRQKLLKEGARVIKKGSLMFLLLGAVNYQYCPKEIERVGMKCISVVPNNEIRTLNIYHKIG